MKMTTKRSICVAAIASVVGIAAAPASQAQLIRYLTASGGDDLLFSTLFTPFTVTQANGIGNVGPDTFDAELIYDASLSEFVSFKIDGFGPQVMTEVTADTFLTADVGNGQTLFYAFDNSQRFEQQFVFQGDLSKGGRIDYVPFNPDAEAGGVKASETVALLRFGAEVWGTMFLFQPEVPILASRGGILPEDLLIDNGFSYFLASETPICAQQFALPLDEGDMFDVLIYLNVAAQGSFVLDFALPFSTLDDADVTRFVEVLDTPCD